MYLEKFPPNELILNILYKMSRDGSYSITTKISRITRNNYPSREMHVKPVDHFSRGKGRKCNKAE